MKTLTAVIAAALLSACASTSSDVVKQEVATAQNAMFNYFTEYAARGGSAASHSPQFVQNSAVVKVAPTTPHLSHAQLQEIAAQEYADYAKAHTGAIRHQ